MANRLPELPLEPRELILVTVAFVLAGLLLMATGALGALGKLRPNPLMGIRTPLTMRDPKAWAYVHRKSAPWVALAGLSFVVAGVVIGLAPSGHVRFWAALVGSAVMGVLLVTGTVLAHLSFRRRNRVR
ncbi:hypothetical protein GCM10010106_45960 [Thermopolyspora flexuosa]|uniref:SdpI/YhfL family protein n=1 Tax=Thermopolyspora flexuosa TaxID=103836 RepID=A0A543IWU0_9ACTN|nr:SdpI family protein [Thermopolyspora flexuosa]PZN10570.1 MAG: hypothetical protein DIU75_24695 [Mycolicibacterium hassiacum]TQM75044.1 SdpI/YhfL family protein [Thermopolyspora flexuosa]GGM92597.1 hypothetical protein GCM10010106_45960 [Thermopolyspora flexuosa]